MTQNYTQFTTSWINRKEEHNRLTSGNSYLIQELFVRELRPDQRKNKKEQESIPRVNFTFRDESQTIPSLQSILNFEKRRSIQANLSHLAIQPKTSVPDLRGASTLKILLLTPIPVLHKCFLPD